MRLDRRFLVVVGCSLLWALLVSLLFYRMATGTRAPIVEKTLVVAAVALAPGAAVSTEGVRMVRVPESLFPKGGYTKAEDVIGRPVVSSIQPDEPLIESRLAPRGSGFGVAPMIPPGMRAVSLRVNDVVGVAGFVLPGMRVDVLVTGKPPGADDTYTATVLQNVTVLSAGQAVEANGKSQSMSVPVVTLLVDPSQAESLTLAASEGHIQLVLRNSSDQRLADTTGRELRDLYARGKPAPPVTTAAAPKPKPVPVSTLDQPSVLVPTISVAPPHTVVVLQGNQRSVESFPSDERKREGSR